MAASCRQCKAHIPDIFAARCPGCGVPITQESVILQEGESQFDDEQSHEAQFAALLYGSATMAFMSSVVTLIVFLMLTYGEEHVMLPRLLIAIYMVAGRWGLLALGLAISGLFFFGFLGLACQWPGFPSREPPAPPAPPGQSPPAS